MAVPNWPGVILTRLSPFAILGVLLGWLYYVLDHFGIGLYFLLLSTLTAYVIVLLGGLVGEQCNNCIDRYIEACQSRRNDESFHVAQPGELVSAHGSLCTVQGVTSDTVSYCSLDEGATEFARPLRFLPSDWKRLASSEEIASALEAMVKAVDDKDTGSVDTFDMASLGVSNQRGTKSSSSFRAALCVLLQSVAPGLLLIHMAGTHDKSGGQLCPYDQGWDEWYSKLVAKGLGVSLLLYTYNYVLTQQVCLPGRGPLVRSHSHWLARIHIHTVGAHRSPTHAYPTAHIHPGPHSHWPTFTLAHIPLACSTSGRPSLRTTCCGWASRSTARSSRSGLALVSSPMHARWCGPQSVPWCSRSSPRWGHPHLSPSPSPPTLSPHPWPSCRRLGPATRCASSTWARSSSRWPPRSCPTRSSRGYNRRPRRSLTQSLRQQG